MPQPPGPGLRGHQQSPLPLVQMREQHPELHGKLFTCFVRNVHTASTSPRPESNTLMIGRQLALVVYLPSQTQVSNLIRDRHESIGFAVLMCAGFR